jgi:hypothetical protein
MRDIKYLRCAHGNEHTGTHDVVHDTFVSIARDANFHVGQKQLHVFFSTMFHSSCWWIDIVFTKNGIRTLTNVLIANSTWVDLLHWSYTTRRFITSKIAQAKKEAIAIDTPLIISCFKHLKCLDV